MLVKWHFMLLIILVLRQKYAQILLDSPNNVSLVPENAYFFNYFKKNLQTQASCVLIIN